MSPKLKPVSELGTVEPKGKGWRVSIHTREGNCRGPTRSVREAAVRDLTLARQQKSRKEMLDFLTRLHCNPFVKVIQGMTLKSHSRSSQKAAKVSRSHGVMQKKQQQLKIKRSKCGDKDRHALSKAYSKAKKAHEDIIKALEKTVDKQKQ